MTFLYTVMRNVHYDSLLYTVKINVHYDNFLIIHSNGKCASG